MNWKFHREMSSFQSRKEWKLKGKSFPLSPTTKGIKILKILLWNILLFNKRVVQPTSSSMVYVKLYTKKVKLCGLFFPLLATSTRNFLSIHSKKFTNYIEMWDEIFMFSRIRWTALFLSAKAWRVRYHQRYLCTSQHTICELELLTARSVWHSYWWKIYETLLTGRRPIFLNASGCGATNLWKLP